MVSGLRQESCHISGAGLTSLPTKHVADSFRDRDGGSEGVFSRRSLLLELGPSLLFCPPDHLAFAAHQCQARALPPPTVLDDNQPNPMKALINTSDT